MYSCSYDNTIKAWDVFSGEEIKIFKGHKNSVNHMILLENQKTLCSCSDDQTIRLWNTDTGEELKKIENIENYTSFMILAKN